MYLLGYRYSAPDRGHTNWSCRAVFKMRAKLVIAALVVVATAMVASGRTFHGNWRNDHPGDVHRVTRRSADADRGYGHHRYRKRYGGGGISGLLNSFNRYVQ